MTLVGYLGITGIDNVGTTIINESAASLENKTIENLQRLVSDKTNEINSTFNGIEMLINAEEDFALEVYCNPSNYTYLEQYDHNAFKENASNPPPDLAYSERYKRNVSFNYLTYKIAPNISKEDVNETINTFSKMITFFKSAVIQHDLIKWIYIGTPQGVHFCYPGHGYNESYDPRVRDWYTRANETGEFGWSEVMVDAGGLGLVITASKPVYVNNKLIGVVATDVIIETINEEIINLEIGKTGYPFLIDEKADIIARPNYTAGNVKWDESFKAENLLNTTNTEQKGVIQKMITGNSGVEEITYPDEKKLIIFAPIKSTKWSLGVSISKDETLGGITETKNRLNENVENTMNTMLYIAVIVSIFLIITCLLLAKTLTRPIKKLTEGAEKISRGDLDTEVDIKTKDEIGTLSDTFNRMVKDLKKSKEKVEVYSRSLEEKVKERTSELQESEMELSEKVKELEKAQKELKTLDKMKSDFLEMAAHELRTPIVAIKIYMDLIVDEKLGRINKKQKEKIGIVSKNIGRLTKIINEMIDVSRIESEKLDIRKRYISISEVMKMVVDDVKTMADEKGQRIVMDMPDSLPNIAVDADLVSKVFMNLLTNAVKYTPEKRRITVKAYDEEKNIHVTVEDEGVGIPEKELGEIFDKFYTGSSSGHKGIGLGLAIVKGIVEGHNGKIWAESIVGKG
ncbi:MAG: HAMP domain-containing protein, partial [Candidatus Thermoplasmatota archaeon]|nr:HAMP domain-containing protein [Candidatus Thermoplasmatota archaeon]